MVNTKGVKSADVDIRPTRAEDKPAPAKAAAVVPGKSVIQAPGNPPVDRAEIPGARVMHSPPPKKTATAKPSIQFLEANGVSQQDIQTIRSGKPATPEKPAGGVTTGGTTEKAPLQPAGKPISKPSIQFLETNGVSPADIHRIRGTKPSARELLHDAITERSATFSDIIEQRIREEFSWSPETPEKPAGKPISKPSIAFLEANGVSPQDIQTIRGAKPTAKPNAPVGLPYQAYQSGIASPNVQARVATHSHSDDHDHSHTNFGCGDPNAPPLLPVRQGQPIVDRAINDLRNTVTTYHNAGRTSRYQLGAMIVNELARDNVRIIYDPSIQIGPNGERNSRLNGRVITYYNANNQVIGGEIQIASNDPHTIRTFIAHEGIHWEMRQAGIQNSFEEEVQASVLGEMAAGVPGQNVNVQRWIDSYARFNVYNNSNLPVNSPNLDSTLQSVFGITEGQMYPTIEPTEREIRAIIPTEC